VVAVAPDIPAVPPVDLRQVLYFVTVARELNFTRAAERLHISAPALSQQIKSLERHLGVQLLLRNTRHVRLTAAGEVFVRSCHGLLHEGEAAVLEARKTARVIDGKLTLAVLHEAESAFEPFLTQFHTTYPGIQFKIATLRHAELLAAVRNRTADAALTWSFLLDRAGGSEGLRWTQVANTEVMAALHPDNPWASSARVPRGEALRGSPAVLFERDYSPVTFDYAVEQLYGPDCPNPPVEEISVTVRAQETMARHIAETRALTPLDRSVADLLGGRWQIRPFDPPWRIDGCLVWQPDHIGGALIAFTAAAAAYGEQRPSKAPAPRAGQLDHVALASL